MIRGMHANGKMDCRKQHSSHWKSNLHRRKDTHMEEYITRTEFERYVDQVKEEMRQRREQRTEEMKAINVNVASADVLTRLDDLKQELTQELKTVSETWLETMQGNYGEHKADFLTLRESQADFRDRLNATATKEDLGKLETRIDRIETTMATKDDISRLETDVTSIKGTQERQEQLLQAILDRLPPKQ